MQGALPSPILSLLHRCRSGLSYRVVSCGVVRASSWCRQQIYDIHMRMHICVCECECVCICVGISCIHVQVCVRVYMCIPWAWGKLCTSLATCTYYIGRARPMLLRTFGFCSLCWRCTGPFSAFGAGVCCCVHWVHAIPIWDGFTNKDISNPRYTTEYV
jgi:hypothetical protein